MKGLVGLKLKKFSKTVKVPTIVNKEDSEQVITAMKPKETKREPQGISAKSGGAGGQLSAKFGGNPSVQSKSQEVVPGVKSKASASLPSLSAKSGTLDPMPSHSNGSMARDRLDRLIKGNPKSPSASLDLQKSSKESEAIKEDVKGAKKQTEDYKQKTRFLKRLMGN